VFWYIFERIFISVRPCSLVAHRWWCALLCCRRAQFVCVIRSWTIAIHKEVRL